MAPSALRRVNREYGTKYDSLAALLEDVARKGWLFYESRVRSRTET